MAENIENRDPQEIKPKPGIESNPIGRAFNVMVSVPDKVEIKMVNASVLADYEIWIFIASLLSNAVVGFWVATSTNTNENITSILIWNSVIFTILFLLTLGFALYKRYKLNSKSRNINLKTSSVEESDHKN